MRDAAIDLEWAGDTRTFRLNWGALCGLQEDRDAGPYVILERLQNRTWRMEDIASTIQWGLIGAGMERAIAAKLVKTFVREAPPLENLQPAIAILIAGLMGAPDEKLGEQDAPDPIGTGSPLSQTERSGSEPSTEPAQS